MIPAIDQLAKDWATMMLRYVQAKPDVFFAAGQNPLIVNLDLQDQRYHSPIGMIKGLRVGIMSVMGEEPWKAEQNDDPFAIAMGWRWCAIGVSTHCDVG